MKREWIDRMATPKRETFVSENITELLLDSNKINMMNLIGCDEKYKNEQMSDYELLAEWERVIPLCRGTGVVTLYEAECQWLGIEGLKPAEKWKQGMSALRQADFSEFRLPKDQIRIDQFVSNFIKLCPNDDKKFSTLFCKLHRELISLEFQEIHLIFELPDTQFIRPNPYGADQALSRINCDEKDNKVDWGLLLTQLWISLCLDPPTDKILQWHLYGKGNYDAPMAFLSYLRERKLFRGEVFFGVFLDTASRIYEELCLTSSNSLRLRPELILIPSDFADGLKDRLDAFFRLYPRGGVTFGGVLTDSPLFFVAHRLLQNYDL